MPITLGELRAELLTCEAEARVVANGYPLNAIRSYRGYYKDAAIGLGIGKNQPAVPMLDEPASSFKSEFFDGGVYKPGHTDMTFPANPTVLEVCAGILLCYGKEFEGYKGGQFLFTEGTDVWVAEYGDASQLAVTGIRDEVDTIHVEFEKQGWDF